MSILIGLFLYFAPTLIAYGKKHRNRSVISVLNLVFGWTGIAWVVCLIWSLQK